MIAASATANCQRVSKFLDRLNAWPPGCDNLEASSMQSSMHGFSCDAHPRKWNKRRDMARRQTPELIQPLGALFHHSSLALG